jgi:hypothetical protein
MTARKDRKGKYHSTLDQRVLGMEEAEDLKRKLFGLEPKPAAPIREAVAKIRKASGEK